MKSPSARLRRLTLSFIFFIMGIGMVSWTTRMPAIRDAIGASTGEMGWILSAMSVGSLGIISLAGVMIRRLGLIRAMVVGLGLLTASLVLIATGAGLAMWQPVALGFAFFGAGMGMADVVLNIAGSQVERDMGRPVLTSMHGFFSIGGALGATLSYLLTRADVAVPLHLLPVAALSLTTFVAVRYILAETPQDQAAAAPQQGESLLKDPMLWLFGVIILAMALAEGSANDWLSLLMVDDYGLEPRWGAFVFIFFTLAMAAARLGAEAVITRLGRPNVIMASAVAGAAGITLITLSHSLPVAAFAGLLWGIGAALGFPVTMSAAADTDDRPEDRVRIVAVAGYMAFLGGPPFLGLLGEHFTLRIALLLVVGFLLCAAVAGRMLRSR